jgi:hypothetical protein
LRELGTSKAGITWLAAAPAEVNNRRRREGLGGMVDIGDLLSAAHEVACLYFRRYV